MLRIYQFLFLLFVLHHSANAANFDELEAAAQAGDTYAMHEIGFIYVTGQDVPKNYSEAIKWFEKAALLGQHNSMFSLGIMHRHGEGIPIDLTKAWAWYSLAAEFIPKNGDEWFIPRAKIDMYQRVPKEIVLSLSKDDLEKAKSIRAELHKTIKKPYL